MVSLVVGPYLHVLFGSIKFDTSSLLMFPSGAGKPNPQCFPFSDMSISLKGTDDKIELDDQEMHDAFQYGLQPGGNPDLRKASQNACPIRKGIN